MDAAPPRIQPPWMRELSTPTVRYAAATAGVTFVLAGAGEQLLPLALHPLSAPVRTLLLVAALATPALPRPAKERARTWLGAAGLLTVAGLALGDAIGAALALAGGSLWLALAPRASPPRAVAVGIAAGVALLPAHAALGTTGVRIAVAAVVAVLVLVAAAAPPPAGGAHAERRGRSLRWRGSVALGALFYLDVALRRVLLERGGAVPWLAVLTGLAAAAYAARAHVAQPQSRRILLVLAGLGAAGAMAAAVTAAGPLLLASRGVLVLLVARAAVPVAARRPRSALLTIWGVWLAAAAAGAAGGAAAAAGIAGGLALLALALLPRPAPWRELA